jgi:Ion channel
MTVAKVWRVYDNNPPMIAPVRTKAAHWRDLSLLLSLVMVVLLDPVLDHGEMTRVILGALIFVPLILATVRLSQIKGWVWPSLALMLSAMILEVASSIWPNRALLEIKWALIAVFLGLTVVGLFSFLRHAHSVIGVHLYTAVSIYLLLGILWAALYCAVDVARPGSFVRGNYALIDRQSELLYFSLVTLSTVGYGDIIPVNGEVRMLAALEAITGVLYIAITVALLVSHYREQGPSS